MLRKTCGLFLVLLLSVIIYKTLRCYQLPVEMQAVEITPERRIKHLGIIMDGNRRWAKRQGFKPWIGHQKGVEPVRTTLEFCIKNKIPYLTLYVFSLENFNRPADEISYLFDVLSKQLAEEEVERLIKEGVRIKFMGDVSVFPERLKPLIEKVERETAAGNNLTLQLLFCYGGQQEIVAACKEIAHQCTQGQINPEDICPALVRKHLWSACPHDPDLIIRTAGEQRLSNFLTWGSAYSELAFLPCYWPDLTEDKLAATLQDFYSRKRNFGK